MGQLFLSVTQNTMHHLCFRLKRKVRQCGHLRNEDTVCGIQALSAQYLQLCLFTNLFYENEYSFVKKIVQQM